tara:strand:+ start:85 stop:399 length:315 start_codon:yes stop_codon:yes gene_type:complete
MSIKVTILNDGTQLLSDLKEVIDPTDRATQYLITKPFQIVYTPEVTLKEEKGDTESQVKKVGLKSWMDISEDSTYIINPATVTTVCEPVNDLKTMYQELTDGNN